MDIRPPNKAFDAFIRHTVKAVCKGTSHTYEDALQVGLLFGTTPAASAGSPMQPAAGNAVTVLVRVEDWKAEFPPSVGAYFESDEVARCTVQHVQRVGDRWHLTAVQGMRVKPS
jgi:hypothetical protein